jgi:thiosulfate reductase cytochrome b subunit
VGLVVSGTAILIAHPRLYWGETGTFAMPAWLEFPLEPIYENTGWGRHLHFLSAWIFVLSGFVYVAAGIVSRHLKSDLLPRKRELRWAAVTDALSGHWRRRRQRPNDAEVWRYNLVQRLTYLFVIFVLSPVMIWTGLGMSPAMSAQYPFLVGVLGGHQSARTLHFIVASLLVIFLLVHLVMLVLVGFGRHVTAMVTGYGPSSGGPS